MTILDRISEAMLARKRQEQERLEQVARARAEELEKFKVSGIPEQIERLIIEKIAKSGWLPKSVHITVEVGSFESQSVYDWLKSVGLIADVYSSIKGDGFLSLQIALNGFDCTISADSVGADIELDFRSVE